MRLSVLILLCTVMFSTCANTAEVQTSTLLQASASEQHYGPFLQGQTARGSAIEGRIDTKLNIEHFEAVARLRLRALDTDTSIPNYPQPRHASLTEAYASTDVTNAWRIAVGKRYLAWGPGILYSPSNRLFPDNGSASPRQEIDGKSMLWASGVTAAGLQLTALAAHTYLERTADVDRKGAFYLVRAERLATGQGDWGWGLVTGGGGGLQPYVGGHLQRSLNDALTAAIEWSASRGYANAAPDTPVLSLNARKWMGDGTFSVRYGLPSGGELAVEYVHNGYHLNAQEASLPWIALLPPSASTQTRYAARHPLTERRYLNLQANLPKFLGVARCTLFLRHLEALDSHGRLVFAELGYSPTDRLTVYVGSTATFGNQASSLVRSLRRAVYVTVELNL